MLARWHLILRHTAFDTLGIVSRGTHKNDEFSNPLCTYTHSSLSLSLSCSRAHKNGKRWGRKKKCLHLEIRFTKPDDETNATPKTRRFIWQLRKWGNYIFRRCVRISCVAYAMLVIRLLIAIQFRIIFILFFFVVLFYFPYKFNIKLSSVRFGLQWTRTIGSALMFICTFTTRKCTAHNVPFSVNPVQMNTFLS